MSATAGGKAFRHANPALLGHVPPRGQRRDDRPRDDARRASASRTFRLRCGPGVRHSGGRRIRRPSPLLHSLPRVSPGATLLAMGSRTVAALRRIRARSSPRDDRRATRPLRAWLRQTSRPAPGLVLSHRFPQVRGPVSGAVRGRSPTRAWLRWFHRLPRLTQTPSGVTQARARGHGDHPRGGLGPRRRCHLVPSRSAFGGTASGDRRGGPGAQSCMSGAWRSRRTSTRWCGHSAWRRIGSVAGPGSVWRGTGRRAAEVREATALRAPPRVPRPGDSWPTSTPMPTSLSFRRRPRPAGWWRLRRWRLGCR